MRPNAPGLSLISTVFTFMSVSAASRIDEHRVNQALHARQTSAIVVNTTGNWTVVGCYTDVSTSRTLSASSIPATNNMTLETCAAFCGSGDYIYAGVEFSKECYCDSTIQVPSVPSPLSDCNMPCSGNSSEICGGSSQILIYTNGEPGPVIVEDVEQWSYAGCFTDSVSDRVLGEGLVIPQGVTAETCTATCQTDGFTIAGVENGQECYCGNTLGNTSLHVADAECREVCAVNHTEYCGAPNRLAVYQFNSSVSAPPPTTCSSDNLSNFTLLAKPTDGSSGEIPLKVVVVEMVPSVTWTILSACPLCCSDWPTYSLQNSVFLPHSLSNPGQLMVSSAPGPGESPNFAASDPAFPGFQSYCAMNSSDDSPNPLLAFGGISNAFALCTNTSINANSRQDVVFEPVSNHLNYVLEDCVPITIEIVTGN